MTGEKDRFTTTEKLWKLEDGELSTPQHDELVFQLMVAKNAKNLLEFIGLDDNKLGMLKDNCEYWDFRKTVSWQEGTEKYFPYEYESNASIRASFDALVAKVYSPLKQRMKSICNEFLREKINETTQAIKCEVPIKTGYNGFIAGYIDVQYITSPMIYKYSVKLESTRYDYRSDRGDAYTLEINPPICLMTICNTSLAHIKSSDPFDRKTINIEVKPKIKSFGETLRQVNTYKELLGDNAEYVIYSPDTRFKQAFESQGIKFVSPTDIGL